MAFYPTPLHREVQGEEQRAARLARMLEIEDEVFQTAAGILRASLDFCHVAPDQQDPPPEWVAELGEDAARKRLAVAKAGWLPSSQAPAGAGLARQVYVGISRARRMQQLGSGPREVNVKISLPAPTAAAMPGAPEYPSKEIE